MPENEPEKKMPMDYSSHSRREIASGYRWDDFLADFGAIQDAERTSNADLHRIDRIDLIDDDVVIFKKFKERTLTLEEFEVARKTALSDEFSHEEFKQRTSRKHFYAWLGNELNKKLLEEIRARRKKKTP